MNTTRQSLGLYFDKIGAWAIYVMIFMLPISKSFIEVTFFVGLVAVVCRNLLLKRPLLRLTPANALLLVFIGTSLLSLFNTQYMALSLKAFFSKTLKYTILFLVAREAIDTKEKLKDFLTVAFLSCIVILVDASIQYFFTHIDLLHYDGLRFLGYPSFQFNQGTDLVFKNAYSPYTNIFLGFPTASFPFPSDFASWILIFFFPIAAGIFMLKKDIKLRVLLAVAAGALLYFLIATKTRGAWLGFICALAIPLFMKLVSFKKVIIALLVVACISPFVIKKNIIPHMFTSAGISDRNITWRHGWQIFMRHPILGNGINTFFVNYMNEREDQYKGKKGSYAHNCFLQMAADIGLVGLAAFLAFSGLVLGQAVSALKSVKEPFYRMLLMGLSMAIVAFLVHSFTDTNLYSLNLASLFWLSMGILVSVTNMAKEKMV